MMKTLMCSTCIGKLKEISLNDAKKFLMLTKNSDMFREDFLGSFIDEGIELLELEQNGFVTTHEIENRVFCRINGFRALTIEESSICIC